MRKHPGWQANRLVASIRLTCAATAMSLAPAPPSPAPAMPDEAFQPGQLGMRHLLGAMTVAAVILGVSAARLRTMTAAEAAQVGIHWAIVLSITGVVFVFASRRRRRQRAAAGELVLRVLSKPMTERRRLAIRWLLTMLVILDGIFISLAVIPDGPTSRLVRTVGLVGIFWGFLRSIRLQMLIGEGMLWGACVNHWLTNVYWVEFREQGILTHARFIPWQSVTRIGWSPVHLQNLVILHGGRCEELSIDPASREVVDDLLTNLDPPRYAAKKGDGTRSLPAT